MLLIITAKEHVLSLVCSIFYIETHCSLQFQATYGKPLLAAKDSKCSAKDAEAGILAMEALHKQVIIIYSRFFEMINAVTL